MLVTLLLSILVWRRILNLIIVFSHFISLLRRHLICLCLIDNHWLHYGILLLVLLLMLDHLILIGGGTTQCVELIKIAE